jgi:hypothetical protein
MYSVIEKQNKIGSIVSDRQVQNQLKILLGKDDWLFLDNDTNRVLDQLIGKLLFDRKQLFKWKLLLETRYSWLLEQGIKYYYLVAPNKECIYPEYVPENLTISEQRPINQLIQHISSSNILPNDFILYPTKEIIAAKSNRLTYPKGDTHWNFYGAYIAYLLLARRIAKHFNLNILDESQIAFTEKYTVGDLADKISHCPESLDYFANHEKHSQCVFDNRIRNTGHLTIWENENKNLPKAILFHDSFSTRMLNFWAESFSRLVAVHQPNLDYEIILQERPDLVISQQVERFLIKIPDDFNGLSNRELVKKKIDDISKQYHCEHINLETENSHLLHSWCLGSPKPGKIDIYNLRGWIIGKDLPVTAIEVVNLDTDKIIKKVSVDILRPDVVEVYPVANAELSGFEVEMPEMAAVFEYERPTYNLLIRAVLSDGEKVPMRMLKFDRK